MERAVEALANKAQVKGLLCSDANGLLISSAGELKGSPAGRFTAISRAAASLCPEQQATVVIETESAQIIVRDYDSMTVAIRCSSAAEN
jgi:hypothetical protein